MKQIIQRDMEFIGGGGDYETQQIPENLKKVKRILENYLDKKEEKIFVCLPTNAVTEVKKFSENDLNSVSTTFFKTTEVKVKRNGSLKLEEVNKNTIKQVQFLHALAKDKKEFDYLYSTFHHEIIYHKEGFPKRISVDDFTYYVLALREIFKINKDERCDILNIKSFAQLKDVYSNFHKYLIFSNEQRWKDIVTHPTQYSSIKVHTFEKIEDYIKQFFSDKELRNLVLTHYTINFQNDKVVAWVKLKSDLFHTIELAKEYHKNQELFLEHGIDFNNLKINNLKAVNAFEVEIRKIAKYKLFTRLMHRLDAKNRQKIRHHKYYYSDYMKLVEDLYTKGLSFDVFEPVLKKIHTYTDCSLLLNALKSVMQERNLYQIQNEIENTHNAKVLLFDEHNQIMIARISSFDAMTSIGSTNWCISKNKSQYSSYCSPGTRFYILYDAKKFIGYPEMIGIVIGPFGKVRHAHDVDDHGIGMSNLAPMIQDYRKIMKSCLGLPAKC